MLTLKRFFIKYPESDKDLFVNFCLDTENSGYFSNLNRIFIREELIIQKPWIGKVDKERNEFKVMRTGTGIFKTGVSALEVFGRLTERKSGKGIEIIIKPIWYVALSFVWVTIFLSIFIVNYLNDITGWAILLCILIIQVLFLVLDLNKTVDKIRDYIDHVRSTPYNKRYSDALREPKPS
jgi:hypothetical protein